MVAVSRLARERPIKGNAFWGHRVCIPPYRHCIYITYFKAVKSYFGARPRNCTG